MVVGCSFWRRVLALAAGDDPEHGVGQEPLQLAGLFTSHPRGRAFLNSLCLTAVAAFGAGLGVECSYQTAASRRTEQRVQQNS
jgi:hypothetical protein